MGTTALSAAKLACEASGWTLTNLQLQKILYIAHMIYSGGEGAPKLIEDESFEAWDYGPVLRSVYHTVSSFGNRPIKNVFRGVEDVRDPSATDAIRKAVDVLRDMPPFKLVELTHWPHGAWSKHYTPGVRFARIPQTDIASEYASRFKNG